MKPTLIKMTDRTWWWFLGAAILLGMALRLWFPGDIEFGDDERRMYRSVQKIEATGIWPQFGMLTGVGPRNPGMSLWVFGALSKVTGCATPPDLARGVQWLNIAALVLLAFFAMCIVAKGEREPWRWAAAFAAVNPFAVLLHRKIWAQSTLPFFCVLFWISWHFRRQPLGAFFWGLLGALMGQIHLSAFYLAAGVLFWTSYQERCLPKASWWLGSLLGAVPLIPWVEYMATGPASVYKWSNLLWLLYPKYWFYWATDPLGMTLVCTFKTVTFMDFLRYPLIGGHGTYLVGLFHVIIIAAGIWILMAAKKAKQPLFALKDRSETGLALNSVLVVAGLLMTLSCIRVWRHYLIMSFPLEWVWMARLGLSDKNKGPTCLMVIWVAEFLISAFFLWYIHVNHGDPLGYYGVTYDFQTR